MPCYSNGEGEDEAMKFGSVFMSWVVTAGFGFAVGYAVGRNEVGAGPGSRGAAVVPALPRPVDTASQPARDRRMAEDESSAWEAAPSDARKPPRVSRQGVRLDPDAPTLGASEPEVTIIVFSNPECAYCARLDSVLEDLLEKYSERLSVQFRTLPLPEHARAIPAAKAERAAHRQGAFWAYHKALSETGALSDEALRKQAGKLGLDLERFDRDLGDPALEEAIRRDTEDARRFGIESAPTSFVNGVPLRGAQPRAYLEALIERELALAARFLGEGTPRARLHDTILNNEVGKPVDLPAPELARGVGVASPPSDAALERGDAPTRGPTHARHELIVFSDFACSHSKALAGMLDRLQRARPNDVVVAFKQYPLPTHRDAELRAIAALAAHRQGRFWAMHDQLFAQEEGELTRPRLVALAKSLGLDAARFERDLDSPEVRGAVKREIAEGVKLGITGTPTLFIDGTRVEGVASYEALVGHLGGASGSQPN